MWVSCKEQYFPIHQMKPCQVDWQKLVFQEKIVLFQRNQSSLLNFKQNVKSTCIYNVLRFGYGVNFRYEGMSSHSFDRFYVVMKIEIPKVLDLNLTLF